MIKSANEHILDKIQNCKTMDELDALRPEVSHEMTLFNGAMFGTLQKAFIKQKNKIKRQPRR